MVFRMGDTTETEELEEPPLEDGSIAAYPNPTNGIVNLEVSANLLDDTDCYYIVVDLSGREVSNGLIVQSRTMLDLTSEASGNYILTVTVGDRKEKWQIVKH